MCVCVCVCVRKYVCVTFSNRQCTGKSAKAADAAQKKAPVTTTEKKPPEKKTGKTLAGGWVYVIGVYEGAPGGGIQSEVGWGEWACVMR